MDPTSDGDHGEAIAKHDVDTCQHNPTAEKVFGGAADDFACPVCGACQELSDACRRCRADLSLVLSVHSALAGKRARCQALVRQRRLLRATRLAKECFELSRDDANRRLLATCYLLQGDFAAALRVSKFCRGFARE